MHFTSLFKEKNIILDQYWINYHIKLTSFKCNNVKTNLQNTKQ